MDEYEAAGFIALTVRLWPLVDMITLQTSELPSDMITTAKLPFLTEEAIAGIAVAIAVAAIMLLAVCIYLSTYCW